MVETLCGSTGRARVLGSLVAEQFLRYRCCIASERDTVMVAKGAALVEFFVDSLVLTEALDYVDLYFCLCIAHCYLSGGKEGAYSSSIVTKLRAFNGRIPDMRGMHLDRTKVKELILTMASRLHVQYFSISRQVYHNL